MANVSAGWDINTGWAFSDGAALEKDLGVLVAKSWTWPGPQEPPCPGLVPMGSRKGLGLGPLR